MKKIIIKELLTKPELSDLEKKFLNKVNASNLSKIVAECTLPLGEEQELIVAKRCTEVAILRCITMLCLPSEEVLKTLTDRQMYHALSVANLELLDPDSAVNLLDNPQINPALRMKIISECKISPIYYKLEEKESHLELLLYLGNKRTSKLYPSQVKFILKRNDKNEIEAMIAKGLTPDAWHLLLENANWKNQAFERLKKEPLSEWAAEVGKFVFSKGAVADKDTFMQIFCEKYKAEQTVLSHELVSLIMANKEYKYLVDYFEAGGLLNAHSYQLVVSANVPKVIEAMKTWPITLRIKK